jgi:fibro-slime domain-containing protein
MNRKLFALALLAALLVACDDDPGTTTMGTPGDGDGAGDGDGDGDADADGAGDGDADADDESAGDGDGDGAGDAGQECATVLHATIRDFKFDHPDFQNDAFQSDVGLKNIVLTDLGTDKKPVYASAAATTQTTGPTEYAQWYHDTDGVNIPIEVDIALTDDGTGRFVYDNQFFFPIDGMGFGNEGMDNSVPSQLRNFAFTTEIHTEFEFKGNEVFTFKGDDDLWLFINGKLAIDLGGLHPALNETVDLAAKAAELGIEPGHRYSMDIFHAERHTDASTFRIETTIDCLIPVIL